MANLILFRPRADLDAERNLLDFIEFVRKNTVLGSKPQFDSPEWGVADVFPAEKGKSLWFYAVGNTAKRCRTKERPLSEPLASFAKAYLAQHHALNATRQTNLSRRLLPLRALEHVCHSEGGPYRISALNGEVFNRALEFMINRGHSPDAVYAGGKDLEEIATFLNENQLVSVPLQWKSYAETPTKLISGLGRAADVARANKLPSQAALDAIPQIFFKCASAPELDSFSIVSTGYCAILMSAPSRSNELLSQPVDFLVDNFSEANTGLGMRWWPEKGGTPLVKPVLEPMADVTRRAVSLLSVVTAQAREMALWYEQNPGKLYFYPDVAHLRGKEVLTMPELAQVLWGTNGCTDSASKFLKRHRLKEEPRSSQFGHYRVRLSEVERAIWSELPAGFPYFAPHRRYSEMLFLTVGASIRQGKQQQLRVVFSPITHSMIVSTLGSQLDRESIFDRHGFTESDGSPIKVKTHQFRHWLNTLAQLSGLSQLDIALWSGRKDVAQNRAYNHITAEQRLEMLRGVVGDSAKATGGLSSLPAVVPIARADYVAQKIPAAHVTDFGYCVHDFSMEPCQLHRDCMFCTEHVCVKGDKAAEARLVAKIAETARLLQEAHTALGDEHAGSDRWVSHNEDVLVRMRALQDLLNNPEIAPGAIIQMNNPDAPSRLKQALETRVRLPQTYPYGKPKDAEENETRIARLTRA